MGDGTKRSDSDSHRYETAYRSSSHRLMVKTDEFLLNLSEVGL